MNSYLNRFLIVFGGAGPYIEKIMKRETFNDIQVWDTERGSWFDLRYESPIKEEIKSLSTYDKEYDNDHGFTSLSAPTQRTQHGGCIYGACLVIYGGLYGENNQILGDTALFDLSLGMWI